MAEPAKPNVDKHTARLLEMLAGTKPKPMKRAPAAARAATAGGKPMKRAR